MGSDDRLELTPELLDDFFAECDEHLGNIRQAVLALETGLDPQAAAPHIEQLFRSFHSLKGIVSMAGIQPAEAISHRAEDYLRALTRGGAVLTAQGLDVLAGAVGILERTVAAFRQGEPLPDVSVLLDQIAGLLTGAPEEKKEPPTLPVDLERKIEQVRSNGLYVCKATFVPSPTLNERGVNVQAVRERLSARGEIIHVAPQVRPGGGIAFELFVALREPPKETPDWADSGVSFEIVATPSAAAPGSATASLAVVPSHLIRVEMERLDKLLRILGDMVVQRFRLEEQIARLDQEGANVSGLEEVNAGFVRQFKELRETVMRLRMVPIAEIFDRMPFIVRDLTRTSQKKVRLEIRGQHTELDKYMVERLKDPLLHLVRNAVSHGIEDAGERITAGKPAEATLTLSASTSGETIIIETADDGRGIDASQVARRAEEMGLHVPGMLDGAALLSLISVPGFSTREQADRAAGRGVGMAVVTSTLRELGGSVSLQTEAGRGTSFTLRLPLTLLITEALIVASAGQRFAVPQNSVEEVVQIEEASVQQTQRAELVSLRGSVLPLLRLRAAFGFPPAIGSHSMVLVSQTDRGRMGLVVDRIVGHRQIVVRSLRDPLVHVAGVIGATELGDGRPLLILDAAALGRQNGTQQWRVNENAKTQTAYDAHSARV